MDRRKFIASLIGLAAATAIPANKLLSDRVKINKNITLNFKTKEIEFHGKVNLKDQLKILSKNNPNIVNQRNNKTYVKWKILICSDCDALLHNHEIVFTA